MIAMLPSSAKPNSQSILKFCFRSCHPSLAPTYPQLARENPQSVPIASDMVSFHAITNRLPATSATRAELPIPPPSRCGDSSA